MSTAAISASKSSAPTSPPTKISPVATVPYPRSDQTQHEAEWRDDPHLWNQLIHGLSPDAGSLYA